MSVAKNYRSAPLPDFQTDGEFCIPPPVEGNFGTGKSWHKELSPWQRLNSHYTYSSVRRHVHFMPYRMIKDNLDFILATTYQHNKECFPEKWDVFLQPATVGRGRGVRGVHAKEDQFIHGDYLHAKKQGEKITTYLLCPGHPVLIGGIIEKINASSIKLMNASHHSPQTNAGYVRQDGDGTLFQY